jgi:hypothetical protein
MRAIQIGHQVQGIAGGLEEKRHKYSASQCLKRHAN